MRWALLIFLAALPAFGDQIPEATRAHLRLLQERLATMPAGKGRDKIAEEVARIRREYGLDQAAGATVNPSANTTATQQQRAREAAAQYRRTEEMFREELRRRAAENEKVAEREAQKRRAAEREWARQQAEAEANARLKKEAAEAAKKNDFVSAAQAEMRRREFLKQAAEEIGRRPQYRSRADFDRAFASHLKFAEDSVAEGGLGFVPAEARQWVEKLMREKTNEQIHSIRFRYNRALQFAKTPKEQGGPGYQRAYARKMALDAAMSPDFDGVENWIKAEKAKLARSDPRAGCRSWFGIFD